MNNLVTIGEAANITGLSAKMIRHYEVTGLIPKAIRSDAQYRLYNGHQLKLLGVIKQAKILGFSLSQIRALSDLWQNPNRASREVKRLAEENLHEIENKISELKKMKKSLQELADNCNDDEHSQCSILDGLDQV
ncbi:MerR family DNA-binding protein [uncultured Paraglaciecola sp.]|jgi:MerR family transcriptional regulator, copper efflux regulator|uniref:MerR family DNA-binding protein n=1 Tax=uncultured Paraglaciecola sp. TaxID=1765024 RepID=UPI0025F54CB5|nr:MerR family DNA-binding protein [uncultured Paraglaciecola sp.]